MKSSSKKHGTRWIIVKVLMNADEYVSFDRQCQDDGVSHSGAFRMLGKQWVREKDSSKCGTLECAVDGQVLPTLPFNKRVNNGATPARLRP